MYRMGVGWEMSPLLIRMIWYHCTDSYSAISFLIWDFMLDEVVTSLRRSVTATSALTSAESQHHTSRVWPWSGTPKVRLYSTFLGSLHHAPPLSIIDGCSCLAVLPLLCPSVVMSLLHHPHLACAGLVPLSSCPCFACAILVSAPPLPQYAYLLVNAANVRLLPWTHPLSLFLPTPMLML